MSTINIHSIILSSRVNGPGSRMVIWVQGCSLGCPGCFNPETHSIEDKQLIPVDDLLSQVIAHSDGIEGLSISGGEPFQQAKPLLQLVRGINSKTDLTILVFSGYEKKEIEQIAFGPEILTCLDVLIAGRYNVALHTGRRLLGSTNQKFHFLTPRYSQTDMERIPATELIIDPRGNLVASGIRPFCR